MAKLRTCPFCGGEAVSFSEDNGCDFRGENEWRAYAGCNNKECGIGIELFHAGDDLCTDADDENHTCTGLRLEVERRWNRRAQGERVSQMHQSDGVHCHECGFDFRVERLDTDESDRLLSDDVFEVEPVYCPRCGAKLSTARLVGKLLEAMEKCGDDD